MAESPARRMAEWAGELLSTAERGESTREVLGALYRWGTAVAQQLGARIDAPPRSRPR